MDDKNVLSIILEHCSISALGSLARVCKRFRDSITDEHWRNRFQSEVMNGDGVGLVLVPKERAQGKLSWKEKCRLCQCFATLENASETMALYQSNEESEDEEYYEDDEQPKEPKKKEEGKSCHLFLSPGVIYEVTSRFELVGSHVIGLESRTKHKPKLSFANNPIVMFENSSITNVEFVMDMSYQFNAVCCEYESDCLLKKCDFLGSDASGMNRASSVFAMDCKSLTLEDCFFNDLKRSVQCQNVEQVRFSGCRFTKCHLWAVWMSKCKKIEVSHCFCSGFAFLDIVDCTEAVLSDLHAVCEVRSFFFCLHVLNIFR